jgi:hypothetical protein
MSSRCHALLFAFCLFASHALALDVGAPAATPTPTPSPSPSAAPREPALPHVHENVMIVATTLDPSFERRDGAFFKDTLFSRDDQVLGALAAGTDVGQHEGGGKSVEVRRFGFNLDHGGVNGGLKVLVDHVPQNQVTQGHGQGYLGALKGLTPELIEDVDVLNGPFSAQYGDFSGLGVVHIRTRERLADEYTLRVQAGSFGATRTFAAWSPRRAQRDAYVAYERARSDGPFLNPLGYARDNLRAALTRHLDPGTALGLRLDVARNDFHSSGQLPLDEIAAGRLERFGFVDPDLGGRARSATLAAYYRRALSSGIVLKGDAFVGRSLFDLWSNFTFFLNDAQRGDEVQQHDSRLQQGANLQVLQARTLFGRPALLVAGGSLHASQIAVSLLPSTGRQALETSTSAHADVTNGGLYVEHGLDVLPARLHVQAGLRYDAFRFAVEDRVDAAASGTRSSGRVQPKFGLVASPLARLPLRLHVNYGRGIASQDARGVVRSDAGPRVSTTDFWQAGLALALARVSVVTDVFLIDRSNEQVYIPDDGSLEFAGPTRSYGYEVKLSAQLGARVSVNAGLTRVANAFYRGTAPRAYVDSAPHTLAHAALTANNWGRLSASLRYRHVSAYRLDGLDATIRARGSDVIDLGLKLRLHARVALDLSIDNLSDAAYYETQNYFESRLRPADPVVARVHATPGYPRTIMAGVTLGLGRP